jgi:hypothetical protein
MHTRAHAKYAPNNPPRLQGCPPDLIRAWEKIQGPVIYIKSIEIPHSIDVKKPQFEFFTVIYTFLLCPRLDTQQASGTKVPWACGHVCITWPPCQK